MLDDAYQGSRLAGARSARENYFLNVVHYRCHFFALQRYEYFFNISFLFHKLYCKEVSDAKFYRKYLPISNKKRNFATANMDN